MFKKNVRKVFIILVLAAIASGCQPAAAKIEPVVSELSPASTETIQESVVLNNCDGTAEVSQYRERSSQINIDSQGQDVFMVSEIKTSINSKYKNTLSTVQGINLVAAPGKKIEYVIEWTIRIQTGIATIVSKTAQFYYRYTVPEKVVIISSQSFTCSQVVPTPTQTVIQTENFVTKEENDNENVNGWISHSAKLYVASTNIGSLTLEYPREILVGESKVIILSIAAEPSLSNFPHKELPNNLTPQSAGYTLQLGSQLQLLPSIHAELRSINFDTISDGYPEKLVVPSILMGWTWNITPKIEGKQTLIVQLEVPVILNDGQETHLLETIQFDIMVNEPPVISLLGQNILVNFSTIITAIIGLTGVILGVYFTYKASKKNSNESTSVVEKQKRTRKKNPGS